MSPALAGGSLTTGPPGKLPSCLFKKKDLERIMVTSCRDPRGSPHLSYPTNYNLRNRSPVSNSETDSWCYMGVSASVSFYHMGRYGKPPSNSVQNCPVPTKISLVLTLYSLPYPPPFQHF